MITIWDAKTKHKLIRRRAASAFVASIAFSPDSTRLFTAAHNGQIQIYGLPDGADVGMIQTPDNLRHIAFTPDGNGLGTVPLDGLARLLQVASWEEVNRDPAWRQQSGTAE